MSQTTPPPRGFPDAEYEQRLAAIQTAMAQAGIDAILLTTEADIRYVSGFATQFWQSPTRPWFVVIAKTGKPIAVIPQIGFDCMARGWLEDIRTWSSPHPSDDGISLLASTLLEVAGNTGCIGMALGPQSHMRLPQADLEKLNQAVRNTKIVDSNSILSTQRMIKSKREIAKISHVCALASNAFEAAPKLFHTGQSDIEAFRAFKIECLSQGVDDVSYLVGGAGANGYGDIISPPQGRKLRDSDILMLDTGCVYDGYFCDFDRNFAFGSASDEARKAYDIVYRATQAGLDSAKPGTTCAELFHAMQSVLETGGASDNDVGRLGHGLGLQLTEPPSHTDFDHTILKPGMVLTLEPGLTFAAGKCMVHEENIVITADGAKLLTKRAPSELPVM